MRMIQWLKIWYKFAKPQTRTRGWHTFPVPKWFPGILSFVSQRYVLAFSYLFIYMPRCIKRVANFEHLWLAQPPHPFSPDVPPPPEIRPYDQGLLTIGFPTSLVCPVFACYQRGNQDWHQWIWPYRSHGLPGGFVKQQIPNRPWK